MNNTIKNAIIFLLLGSFLFPFARAASITIQTPSYETSVLKDSTFTITVPIQASGLSADITATLTPSSGNGLSCASTADCQKSISQSGGTATFSLRADTTGTKSSPFTISASSQGTTATPVTPSSPITVEDAPSWSIGLTKSASTVSDGDFVTFQLTTTISAGTLRGATVSMSLPSGWTITSGSASYSLGDLSISTTSSWTIRADSASSSNEFTVTVTGTNAQSSKTETATVTKTSSSPGAPPGSSSSGGSSLGASGEIAKATKSFASVSSGVEASLLISNEKIAVSEVAFIPKGDYKSVSLTVASIARPANLSAAPGMAYQYMKIDASNLPVTALQSARIKFKIPLTWFTKNGLDRKSVVLYRYAKSWEPLATVESRADTSYAYFEATSPGFSYFAITAQKAAPAAAEPAPAAQPGEPSTPGETKTKQQEITGNAASKPVAEQRFIREVPSWLPWLIGIIGLLIVLMIIAPKTKETRNRKSH